MCVLLLDIFCLILTTSFLILVLKSSGSAFTNFIRDEFTTLVEAKDRILSTAVDLQYEFPKYTLRNGLEFIGALETELQFEKAAQLARNITIDLFATHDSESVQVCDIPLSFPFVLNPRFGSKWLRKLSTFPGATSIKWGFIFYLHTKPQMSSSSIHIALLTNDDVVLIL